MFEQSILINYGENRRWNFLASLSVEIAMVTLALLIPLAYTDHLPVFQWKQIVILPPKPMPQPIPVEAVSRNATNSPSPEPVQRPLFRFVPNTGSHTATPVTFTPDAPPTISAISGLNAVSSDRILSIKASALPPPPKPASHPAAQSAPIRVGGMVQMAKLIRMVRPEYPALARTARISGTVHLMATIAKDGTIRNLQLVDGHPILAQAAMRAVAQWVYKPTLLNNEPVEVIAPIEVNFNLGTGF